MSSQIELRHISKSYTMGDVLQTVLHDITLDIHQGELLAIMGPSGSGKSSMMNILGLLDRPTQGSYHLDDAEVATLNRDELAIIRNRTMGFVFQQFYLLPRLTAAENIALPLMYRGCSNAEIDDKVAKMLAKVSMTAHAEHKPNQLSGGQQQRVAIARALVGNPEVILADEPTGALDSHTGQEVMDLFLSLNASEKTTTIIVTHDPKIAQQCKRVIKLQDGRIVS